MAKYAVSSEQLQDTAGKIKASHDRIQQELQMIMKQVQGTKDFWTGNANATYDRMMSDWQSSADRVRQNLDATVAALSQAAREYDETERAQVSRFNT